MKNSNRYVDVFGLSECSVEIYRGTDRMTEKETGYIMSDAAQQGYMDAIYGKGLEGDAAINHALESSKKAEVLNIEHFGSMEEYVKAHGLGGTEFSGPAPRSLHRLQQIQQLHQDLANLFSQQQLKV